MPMQDEITHLKAEIDRLRDLIGLTTFAADDLGGPHADWTRQLVAREAELQLLENPRTSC
jgi:hypothetical protein